MIIVISGTLKLGDNYTYHLVCYFETAFCPRSVYIYINIYMFVFRMVIENKQELLFP
jgi:hypothetical protein